MSFWSKLFKRKPKIPTVMPLGNARLEKIDVYTSDEAALVIEIHVSFLDEDKKRWETFGMRNRLNKKAAIYLRDRINQVMA